MLVSAGTLWPVSDLHAAIDIGTNSMHLVVARVDGEGHFVHLVDPPRFTARVRSFLAGS